MKVFKDRNLPEHIGFQDILRVILWPEVLHGHHVQAIVIGAIRVTVAVAAGIIRISYRDSRRYPDKVGPGVSVQVLAVGFGKHNIFSK
ncbi:hypothetical protein D9M69_679330 [compost metagenome]